MAWFDNLPGVDECRHCGSVSFGTRPSSDEVPTSEAVSVDDPELPVVLRDVFGISETGIELCVRLMGEGESTAGDLAEQMDVNRSTVSRQLNHLADVGLLEKHQRLLTEGGYVHVYSPVDVEKVRRRLAAGLHEWCDEARELVEHVNREKLEAMAEAEGRGEETTDIYWDR